MQRLSSRSSPWIASVGLVIVSAVAACSIPARPTVLSPSSSPVAATAVPATPSGEGSNAAGGTIAAVPPAAALAAEGGDPTDGQLGTYVWGDGGSDSPWLPGTRIAVGSGEPLAVSFRPESTIATWSARSVPSTADGPADATALGQGSGRPRFMAPEPGTWTVEVHVVFANAAGNASYFWQLAVD